MISAIAGSWRSLVVRGVLVIALGIAALAFPSQTIWIVGAFALYAIVHGAIDIAMVFRSPGEATHAVLVFLEGAIWVAGGAATFHWLTSAFTLGYVVAFWALGLGAVAVVIAVAAWGHLPDAWMLAVVGVLAVAFGGWLLHDPVHLFLMGPAIEIAALAFVSGASMLVLGFQGRKIGSASLK
ncbi:MAG: DUF308 domain-containing protein [Vulcanimicrobiaceae bacterium]